MLGVLDDGIDRASWRTSDERAIVRHNFDRDGQETPSHSLPDGFTSPRVWQLCGIYFIIFMDLYGVGFVSPHAVGWIIDAARSTTLGVYALTACLMVGSLLALTMPARLVNR